MTDNIEIMINDKAEEVIEEQFLYIKIGWKHQRKLVILSFDCLHLLYC